MMITKEIKNEIEKIFQLSCLFSEAANIGEDTLETLADVIQEKLAKLRKSLIQ